MWMRREIAQLSDPLGREKRVLFVAVGVLEFGDSEDRIYVVRNRVHLAINRSEG